MCRRGGDDRIPDPDCDSRSRPVYLPRSGKGTDCTVTKVRLYVKLFFSVKNARTGRCGFTNATVWSMDLSFWVKTLYGTDTAVDSQRDPLGSSSARHVCSAVTSCLGRFACSMEALLEVFASEARNRYYG